MSQVDTQLLVNFGWKNLLRQLRRYQRGREGEILGISMNGIVRTAGTCRNSIASADDQHSGKTGCGEAWEAAHGELLFLSLLPILGL
jgi:hypothetical protein